MLPDEQTTQTTTDETTNSGSSTTTANEQSASDTSTTDPAKTEDTINLGKAPAEADAADPADQTDDAEDKGEAGELFGAPEEGAAYEISGLPEGTVIDEEALKAMEPEFREFGLSNAGASRLITAYAEKVLPRVSEQVVNGINADVTAKRAEWEGEARELIAGKGEPLKNAAGETIGFDGLSSDKVLKTAAKALDKLAPAGFREWLEETGLGVHPQMLAFAYQASKLVAEDTDLETADKGAGPKTRTQKFYGR